MSVKNTADAAPDGASNSPNANISLENTAEYLSAEKAALQLIARAEQNKFGLIRKLEKRGHDSLCINAVINSLCETGMLDDSRYARLWLELQIARKAVSPFRLLVSLVSRGIERETVESVLRETLDEETELQLLKRYAEKLQSGKQKNHFIDDEDNKLLRYKLKTEGFSSQAISAFFESN